MQKHLEFKNLVLLIGTNPLPNFVVADYFLQANPNIQHIWLVHSEDNGLQIGTHEQAKRLESLLRKRWEGEDANLLFPLKKISISDVSNAAAIFRDIEIKMLKEWRDDDDFHLNYTGGTKAMATHVYRRLQERQKRGQKPFSYLDANKFRLVVDDCGVERFKDSNGNETDDLRKKVGISFEDLIALHGFEWNRKGNPADRDAAEQAFRKYCDVDNSEAMTSKDGRGFEKYIYMILEETFEDKFTKDYSILFDREIQKPDWSTKFQLDVMVMHGYHLAGVSCTVSDNKDTCKSKGFEVILRTRQIGGDEARSILITRVGRTVNQKLQEELMHDTGGLNNILVLGVDDLRHENIYLKKIENFVFCKD